MSSIPRFVAYAAAFEKAYASDDWTLLAPFFTEDAVYDSGPSQMFGGVVEGRAAILDYFQRIVNAFDRRFATRGVELLEGPRVDGDAVWLRGRGRYTSPVVPDLAFELEEIATFAGDRICRLEDRYDAETAAAIERYFAEHGARLGLTLP
jgi:hypothetical protein